MKEAAGKAMGDAKLEAEGKADKSAGKVQNAVGGLKDALRGNNPNTSKVALPTGLRHLS